MIELLRIPLEDQPGQLHEVVTILARAKVDMKALSLMHHAQGNGDVLLLVTDITVARAALEGAGRSVSIQPAVVIEVADHTGGLAAILEATTKAELSINDLFTFVSRLEGKALAVATFGDNARAEAELKKAGLRTFDQKALSGEPAVTEEAEPGLSDYLGGSFFW